MTATPRPARGRALPRLPASSLGAAAIAFAVELILLAVLRRVLDPDPEGEQLYIVWIFSACVALSLLVAQSASYLVARRLNFAALIGAPALMLAASWLLWMSAFLIACDGKQTPFFRLSCN